ncbi:hypothetical protein M1D72_13600 [Vibrio sp. AK197]
MKQLTKGNFMLRIPRPSSFTLCTLLALNLCAFSATSAEEKNGHDLVNDVYKQGTEVDIDEDQDDVYDAVKAGKIRPFSELYNEVEQDLFGRIIKVELEEDDDEWIYELKLIHDGRIVQVKYSATTLEMRLLKGRDLKSVLKFQPIQLAE